MYIVLLGPPGSGKGTHGRILAEYLGINHLSTGDMFREILSNPSHPLYEKVKVINEGKLVTDEVVNHVVENAINSPRYRDGVIFDGYPRTVAQAEALNKILSDLGKKLDLVLDFDVTEDVLLYRLLGRRVCPKCKRVFHIRQELSTCPDCNMPLIKRDDDNEETIKERFEEYRSKTAPLHDYYRNSGIKYITLVIDDYRKTPEDIQQELVELLRQHNII